MSQTRELCSVCGVRNPNCKKNPCPWKQPSGFTTMFPEEREMLEDLNIHMSGGFERLSDRLWDFRFDYERRYYLGSLGGKTVKVVEYTNGKSTQMPSFTMPPGDELQRVKASAWMPLLMIGLAHDKFCTPVCRIAFGAPLPDYAGDWSFIRDMDKSQQWHIFEQVRHRWFSVPAVVKANFAQP